MARALGGLEATCQLSLRSLTTRDLFEIRGPWYDLVRVLRFSKLCRAAAAVAVAVVCFPAQAAAPPGELAIAQLEKVRIEYRAPPECPDASAFKGLVSSRVLANWEAAPDEFARRVVVVVSGVEGDYTATVELADEAGAQGAKTVSGAVCANVVDGIALATALAIEPRGKDGQEPWDAGVTPADRPAADAATAPAAVPPPTGATPREQQAEPDSPAPSAAPDGFRLSGVRLGARALLATGVGPKVAGGAALGIVFEARRARLGLALQGWRTGRLETRGVRARFERLSLRVDGCPIMLAFSEWMTVEPCPFVELGVVAGEAFEDPPAVVRGNRGSAPWYAAGGLGRLVGRFGRFVVELEGAAGAPLRRERFYVERGDEIHRVPAYYGAFAAGLGVIF
jgi:hypothetical protein